MATVTDQIESLRRLDADMKRAARLMGRAEVRNLVDLYYQVQEFRKAAANQSRSATEGEPQHVVEWVFESTGRLENNIKTALGEFVKEYKIGRWLTSITGIGPVISAGLLTHIDIRKAKTAGNIWRFAGLDPTVVWESRADAKKAITEELKLEAERTYTGRDAVDQYIKYAREARPATQIDVEAAGRLIETYGASTVRAVMPTLARVHNGQKLFNQNVSNFETQFASAVAFYRELCDKHEIIERPEDEKPISLPLIRILADQFGRNPYSLYQRCQRNGEAPTVDSTAAALCRRPYNADLKRLAWIAGDCFVKFQNHKDDYYGKLFVERKKKEVLRNERGELADQAREALAKKKFRDGTISKAAYEQGKLPDGRINLRALRWTAKIFLSHVHHAMHVDYYGIEPTVPYAFGMSDGNHSHFIPLPNWPFEEDGKSLRELLIDPPQSALKSEPGDESEAQTEE